MGMGTGAGTGALMRPFITVYAGCAFGCGLQTRTRSQAGSACRVRSLPSNDETGTLSA